MSALSLPRRTLQRGYRALLAVAVALSGCSLLVDTDSIAETACRPGTRLCGDVCAELDDPGYGCGDIECNPCGYQGNAAPTKFECVPKRSGQAGFECSAVGCLQGFTSPGCGENLNTMANACGPTRAQCAADEICFAGVCSK